MSQLRKYYQETVVPILMKELGVKNPLAVPRITKITLNMGVGEAVGDKKIIEVAKEEMAKITGQKPVVTLARKSVAGFKIREGWPIGVKVTLRGDMMFNFLQRLINLTLPRVRDFRGLNPRSFDGRGNFSFGLKDLLAFTEINFDSDTTTRGVDVTLTTTAKEDKASLALLNALRFPLRKV